MRRRKNTHGLVCFQQDRLCLIVSLLILAFSHAILRVSTLGWTFSYKYTHQFVEFCCDGCLRIFIFNHVQCTLYDQVFDDFSSG